jgi:L-threonylcarbamoyladenylate synthase
MRPLRSGHSTSGPQSLNCLPHDRPSDQNRHRRRQGVAEAARILKQGGLVAFPTETVYGLGADATNGEAVAAIFAAKGRPLFNPLIVHVADLEEHGGMWNFRLAPRRWRRNSGRALSPWFCRGAKNSPLSLLGQRRPGHGGLARAVHPAAIALLKETGRPVAGPSANQSGQVTATTAAHVAESLGGKLDFILDAAAPPWALNPP